MKPEWKKKLWEIRDRWRALVRELGVPVKFVERPREFWGSLSIEVPCDKCTPTEVPGEPYTAGSRFDIETGIALSSLASIEVHRGRVSTLYVRCEKCDRQARVEVSPSGVHFEYLGLNPRVLRNDEPSIEYLQMKNFLERCPEAAALFVNWKMADVGPWESGIRNAVINADGFPRLGTGVLAAAAAVELRKEAEERSRGQAPSQEVE